MGLTSVALLGIVVKKLTDTLSFVTNKQWKQFFTQVGVFAIGFVTVLLAAHASAFKDVVIGGISLAGANGATEILLGVLVGSAGSTVFDGLAAFDNTQSAAKPSLVPPPSTPAG